MGALGHALGRILETGDAESAFGRELLKVRYRALQRQIPLVYAIALATVFGFHFAVGPSLELLLNPLNLLVLLVIARLAYWVHNRDRELEPERIKRELQTTLALAVLFSAAGGFWAVGRLVEEAPQQDLLVLFSILAAIGCAYGLGSFPSAARLPLLLFALPFSLVLALSPNHAHIGIGVTLVLITLLTLRLVDLQNRGLVELVRSRFIVDSERARARQAETEALAEKARVRLIADSDSLTGLANRRAFLEALEARLADNRDGLRARSGRPGRLQADQRHVRARRRRRRPGSGRRAARGSERRAWADRPHRRRRVRAHLPLRQRDGRADRGRGALRPARDALSGRDARIQDFGLLRHRVPRARRL